MLRFYMFYLDEVVLYYITFNVLSFIYNRNGTDPNMSIKLNSNKALLRLEDWYLELQVETSRDGLIGFV